MKQVIFTPEYYATSSDFMTVNLINSIIEAANLLQGRNFQGMAVKNALDDLNNSKALRNLIYSERERNLDEIQQHG